MKKVLMLIGVLLLITACSPYQEVCHDQGCFTVEIADTNEERAIGLMDREVLGENEGMLFVYQEEKERIFWMKDTKIPLDMVWINAEKEIVGITENALPCEKDPCDIYPSGEEAQYVLEINAGRAKEAGLEIGEKLEF